MAALKNLQRLKQATGEYMQVLNSLGYAPIVAEEYMRHLETTVAMVEHVVENVLAQYPEEPTDPADDDAWEIYYHKLGAFRLAQQIKHRASL